MAIAVLARLFWAICAARRITPWLERASPDNNISDLPTRNTPIPYRVKSISDFLRETASADGPYRTSAATG